MKRRNVGAPFVGIRRRTDTTVPEMKNNGITLIALIITIIIMLILAGIVITMTLGENGIIGKAIFAKNKYIQEQEQEKNALDELYSQILVAGDSKITLTMEQLNEYIDRKIEEKNANKVSITATSSKTYTTNSSDSGVDVEFDSITGDTKNKFTLENGNIKIGAGVKRILVTSVVNAKSDVEGIGLEMWLDKNNEYISENFTRAPGAKRTCSIVVPSTIMYVNEGDLLKITVNDWGGRRNIYKL